MEIRDLRRHHRRCRIEGCLTRPHRHTHPSRPDQPRRIQEANQNPSWLQCRQHSPSLPMFTQHKVLDEGSALARRRSATAVASPKLNVDVFRRASPARISGKTGRPRLAIYRGRSDREGALFIGSEALPSVNAKLAMGLCRKLVILASKVDHQQQKIEHSEFKQAMREKRMIEERDGRSMTRRYRISRRPTRYQQWLTSSS